MLQELPFLACWIQIPRTASSVEVSQVTMSRLLLIAAAVAIAMCAVPMCHASSMSAIVHNYSRYDLYVVYTNLTQVRPPPSSPFLHLQKPSPTA